MSNKEIVQQGLNARKDVRAAEARAEKFRQDAADQSDARFYERNKHRLERADWLEEKAVMEKYISTLEKVNNSLTSERDRLIQHEKAAQQRQILLGSAKAILAVLLLTFARDLGWIVTWLATVLQCLSAGFLVYAFAKLTRNK